MDFYDEVDDDGPPVIDPYEVLEIDRNATAEQVKSAYRKAALKNHPGTNFMFEYFGHLFTV
jgi:DnaJ homolog subfamily C member 9